MLEYRFDKVPAGTYTVELGFAEPGSSARARGLRRHRRGPARDPGLDLALEAGTYTAVNRQYTVKVTDGQLNVRFVANSGKTLVNSIRVTDRPDLVG